MFVIRRPVKMFKRRCSRERLSGSDACPRRAQLGAERCADQHLHRVTDGVDCFVSGTLAVQVSSCHFNDFPEQCVVIRPSGHFRHPADPGILGY